VFKTGVSVEVIKGDDALMDADELPLIGQHNIVNVLAALALGRQIHIHTKIFGIV
jgi:UDP-N-acetylmuramate-alanine ligase